MSGTIESTNSKITEKIDAIRLIVEQIQHLSSILDNNAIQYRQILAAQLIHINLIADDIIELESRYNLAIVQTLNTYYSKSDKYSEESNTKTYYQIINSENYVPKIDQFLKKASTALNVMVGAYLKYLESEASNEIGRKMRRQCKNIRIQTDGTLRLDDPLYPIVEKIRKHIEYASNITITIEFKRSNYEMCTCGEKMTLLPATSELHCSNSNCQQVRSLYGTAADELDACYDGGKSKHGKYDPSRHFRFWMERLQAKEHKIFPQDHLDKIDRIIRRDQIELTSVYEMRMVLKETRLTSYNVHCPLLMKMTTGKSPPQFSFGLLKRFSSKFNKIIEILEELIEPDNNRSYYPYFIYKIAEDEADKDFKKGDFEEYKELKRFLLYIHLQSSDTIRKNDKLYKEICTRSQPEDELVFKPTEIPVIRR
jgi:hypothetical protein